MNCNTSYQGALVDPVEEITNSYSVYGGLPCGYDVCAYQYGGDGNFFTQNGHLKANGILARLKLPCQSSSDWNYDQCYSYYANGCYNTCQFINMGDIEDFMWVDDVIGAFKKL